MPGKQLREVYHDERTGEWKNVEVKPDKDAERGKGLMKRMMSTRAEDNVLTPITTKKDDDEEEDATLTWSLMVLITLVAIVASVLSFGVDTAGVMITGWKTRLAATYGAFNAEAGADAFLIIIARLCVQFAPNAAGSGIPEVKCILTGGSLSHFLIFPVLVAKCVGLTCAVGAGLPLGKEGPFVHIAACCGAQLLKMKMFSGLRGKRDASEIVLLCAVSVGVGATFSAPIGGMLFALELMMPHVYDLASYRACFAAAAMGSCVYQLLKLAFAAAHEAGAAALTPLINSNVNAEASRTARAEGFFLLSCILVGTVCGVLGGLFVRFHRKTMGAVKVARGMGPPPKPPSKKATLLGKATKPKASFCGPSLLRDLVLCVALAVAGAALKIHAHRLSFIGDAGGHLLSLGGPPAITELFNKEGQGLSVAVLAAVFLIKWFHSAVAISMPVPTGCVAPCLVLGALFGRLCGLAMPEVLWGEFAHAATGDDEGNYYAYVARFAIIGAAAFTASVCQTVSIVVTIFELIAVPGFVLPLILGTLAGVMCSQQIAPSIYDSILMAKGLPCLPALSASHKADKRVSSVMHDDVKAFALNRRTSRAEVQMMRKRLKKKDWSASMTIPIVELIADKYVLVGCVDDKDIDEVIAPGQLAPTEEEDILDLFAAMNLLVTPLRIDAHESLSDVYMEAQTMHYDRTMFVVDHGFFVGILTLPDLFLIR